jgi:hypothetical protein
MRDLFLPQNQWPIFQKVLTSSVVAVEFHLLVLFYSYVDSCHTSSHNI